jgi:hypothetical protein
MKNDKDDLFGFQILVVMLMLLLFGIWVLLEHI